MGRRSNGEGSFHRLKSGSWQGQLMDGYNDDGTRHIVSVTAPTKSEAQQKIRQYIADREAGKQEPPAERPFSEYATQWYKGFEGQVQPSTYDNYKYTLATLIRYFQDRPISEIRKMDVNAFLKKLLEDGYSRSKVSKCKAMLIQIFDDAEENELVGKNPALRAKAGREPDEEEGSKDAFTEAEVAILMERLPDDLLGNSIRTMLASGLRAQELLALTPSDIAEDGSYVSVNKAIKTVGATPTLGPPKSKRGKRIIPIPEDYRQYVRFIREHGGKAFIWASGRNSLLYSVGSFRRKYYKVLREIPGVRPLSPHCCRHTYITRLEAKGVPMQLIARLAGHSNIGTTAGYTHTELDTLADAVAQLNGHGARNTVDITADHNAIDKEIIL